jgi:hypothetical protein
MNGVNNLQAVVDGYASDAINSTRSMTLVWTDTSDQLVKHIK